MTTKTNYHTHSVYCDGADTIEVMTEHAFRNGFDQLGFSSHAPLLRMYDFLISEEEIPSYIQDIEKVQQKYPAIQLWKGLENDFVPGWNRPFQHFKTTYRLDFIIGGVHLVKPPHIEEFWFIDGPNRQTFDDGLSLFFNGNIERAVTQFWEQTFAMIETEKFDIIAHLDKIKMHNQKRFFTENEKWYLKLVDHAIDLIKQKDLIMEINSRGIYKGRCPDFYPSDYILRQAAKKEIPCVISADAHKGTDLGQLYQESLEKLKNLGIKELAALTSKGWSYEVL